jgi:hypothetical protein
MFSFTNFYKYVQTGSFSTASPEIAHEEENDEDVVVAEDDDEEEVEEEEVVAEDADDKAEDEGNVSLVTSSLKM